MRSRRPEARESSHAAIRNEHEHLTEGQSQLARRVCRSHARTLCDPAAEKLSRTQPAVSASLRSLRATFRDKLFTRKSQGMAPTLVATALYEDLLPSLDMIEATLNKRMSAGKDPPTPKQRDRFADRFFKLGCLKIRVILRRWSFPAAISSRRALRRAHRCRRPPPRSLRTSIASCPRW